MSGGELREAIRKNCGIIYALFKKRLSNSYCRYNNRMQKSEESNNWHHKYQLALVKGGCLEFRVPSRFQSVKQMMRRYELFYEVVNYSIATPNGSHDGLLKKIKPIILSMYNGNEDEANEVLRLSKLFRAFILKGEIHQDISMYLS